MTKQALPLRMQPSHRGGGLGAKEISNNSRRLTRLSRICVPQRPMTSIGHFTDL
jgi:hypothetical protein